MRKLKISFPALICCLAAIASVVATGWIYGNTVNVTVSAHDLYMTVDNANPDQYENVTFTTTLTRGGVGLPGETIELQKEGVTVATNTTDSNGICTFTLNMTTEGSFNYRPRWWRP